MAKLNAIARLLGGIRDLDKVPYDYRASLQIFPDLNIDRVATDLSLAERGADKGRRNEPQTTSQGLDDIETSIVERVEAERRSAHTVLLDEMRTYAERLSSLDFEGRFNLIRQAAPAAVAEFQAEATTGRDELHEKRRHLKEVEDERLAFRRKNSIDRTARVSSGGTLVLKAGFLAILFLLEIGLNAYFLSKGSDYGILGGAIEAVVFATLNVIASFLVAAAGFRQLYRKGFVFKIIGAASLCFYLCFAVLLNMALAHYREVSSLITDDPGGQVIARIYAHPLGLTDLKSWLFAILGFFFSTLAFIDALLIYDPYPGYGPLECRYRQAHSDYRHLRSDRIEELRAILQETTESLDEVNRDLSVRRSEYDQILEARVRLVRLFESHQAHIERMLTALLSVYREANKETRSTNPPRRFKDTPKLERIAAEADLPDNTAKEDLRRSISEAQSLLTVQIDQIHAAFASALAGYQQIDDIVKEPANDASIAQAA